MSSALIDSKEKEDVKAAAIELYELDQKFKAIKDKYDVKKAKLTSTISNFMFCMKPYTNGFSFSFRPAKPELVGDWNRELQVKKVVPTKVKWNPDKLEKVLDKSILAQVINRTYKLRYEDMKELSKYLKSCGVSQAKFMEYVTVEKTVDVSQLEQLESIGKIDKEKLHGCYEVEKLNSYLKIKLSEGKE